MMNENAISNVLIDVDFLDDALKRIGRPHLISSFVELRSVRAATLGRRLVLIQSRQHQLHFQIPFTSSLCLQFESHPTVA